VKARATAPQRADQHRGAGGLEVKARATAAQIDTAARLRIACALVTRAQRQQVRGTLTPVQLSALQKVDLFGPLRLGDLAQREQVRGPTMSRVVASLEQAGLVHRAVDPKSARCSLVVLSAEGREQLDATRRDYTDFMACRLTSLGPEHQAALAAALPALEALVAVALPGEDAGRAEVERNRSARARLPATRALG
jgi:DNA-binding MarR family transcriptional regulator